MFDSNFKLSEPITYLKSTVSWHPVSRSHWINLWMVLRGNIAGAVWSRRTTSPPPVPPWWSKTRGLSGLLRLLSGVRILHAEVNRLHACVLRCICPNYQLLHQWKELGDGGSAPPAVHIVVYGVSYGCGWAWSRKSKVELFPRKTTSLKK